MASRLPIERAAEYLDRVIANANPPNAETPRLASPNATAGDSGGLGVCLVRGDTIIPEAVHWIWDGWLAAGKFHVLAGRPGTGKTTLALAFAATITNGGRWPDGMRTEPGNVLIWSGEDDPKDTLAPRLIVNGALMERVYFIAGSIELDGKPGTFDPARHMAALELEAARIGNVRLLVVDPVVSAVDGDGNSNTEVRRALQPIVDLAARLDCSALGISHFTKGSDGRDVVERVTGSLAFGAAARVVLAAAKIKNAEGQGAGRIVARAKSNIGPDSGGFGYDVQQVELADCPGIFASRVLWSGAIAGTARELLSQAEADDATDGGSPRQFLADLLADGPMAAAQVLTAAEAHSYSREQMRRARVRLGVKPVKAGMAGGWIWALPTHAGHDTERTEGAEDAGYSHAAPSVHSPDHPYAEGTAPGPEIAKDAGPEKAAPSAPSALSVHAWRVTRANGESFNFRVIQGATLAEVQEQFPGSSLQPMPDAAREEFPIPE
jgi:putative DNA primase/helicase